MSNLNPRQFQQLTMFEPVQKIIDEIPKGDVHWSMEGESPRDQWMKPGGAQDDPEMSLRDWKLTAESSVHMDPEGFRSMIRRGDMEPIGLTYGQDREGRPNAVPHLGNGHHRLAFAENMGHTEIPVQHNFRAEHKWGTGEKEPRQIKINTLKRRG